MATIASVFAEARSDIDLSTFANQFARVAEAPVLKERESSNYLGGSYFRASENGLEITLALSDEANLEAYRFWICVTSSDLKREAGDVARMIADRLAKSGHPAFVPSDNWMKRDWDEEGERYDV